MSGDTSTFKQKKKLTCQIFYKIRKVEGRDCDSLDLIHYQMKEDYIMNQIPQTSSVYISLTNNINTHSCQTLLSTIMNIRLQNSKLKEVHLLLSTNGGNVNDGIAIFNILRSLPLIVHTYNVGKIDSIGNVVFLAGEKRYTLTTASFMLHGVSCNFTSPVSLNEKTLLERLESIRNDQNLISEIVSSRCSLEAGDINSMFLGDTIIEASRAKELNIVHEIISKIEIPVDSTIIQLML